MIIKRTFRSSSAFLLPFKKQNRLFSASFKAVLALLLLLTAGNVYAQPGTVSGTVTAKDDNQPVPGVSVMLKGTTTGTQTDNTGKYRLKLPAGNGHVLVFSFMGYAMQEIAVNGQSTINAVLASDQKQLKEVVVSGYTSQSKKDFTGAATRVGGQQLENRPMQSFDQALAGQAPGVSIIQPSGVLNNPPVFRIRGFNSISLSSYPLIIIDGVAVFTGSLGNAVANNPLADINPSDIESMDILKDASATAIYGSRAANGVVVITTKKGKQGKTKVNYEAWVGFTKAMNLPELLNAEEYVIIKNEAQRNAGIAEGYALQTLSDGSTVNTSWYDAAYRTGVSQNHNINFSGANDKTSYYLSAGYSDQHGIIRTDGFNRKNVRGNIDHSLYSFLKMGVNFTYSNTFNQGPNSGSLPGQNQSLAGLARMTYIAPPNVAVYNEDGSFNIDGRNSVGYGANTTRGYNAYNLAYLLEYDKYTSENNTVIGNLYAELEIFKGLKAKTSYSINRINAENKSFRNPVHGDGGNYNGIAENSNSRFNRTDWINTLNYVTSIANQHNINALIGYEEIYTTIDTWGAQRTNLTDPYFTTYQGGYSTIVASNNVQGVNGFRSYFSNLFYDFKKKYLLSASFRRDGFSGLAQGRQFGNFAGGSIGWNVSEEGFYANSRLADIVNNLKIRASYGKVGNVGVGDFSSLSLYSSGLYGAIPTLGYSQAGNALLGWETSKKTDIGINFSLLNNRIAIEADYYNNNIDGLVLDAKQAPSKGIPNNTIATNVGSMYNRGFEFSITAHIINKEDFKWTSSFNLTTLKNRVTALANNADIYSANGIGVVQSVTRVGYAVGSIFAVETTGVNPDNGQRIFINRFGREVQYNHASATNKWTYLDGTPAPAIDGVLDGKISGSGIAPVFGGFNNTFTYKAFDLNLGITYSSGNKIYNGTKATISDQRYFNNRVEILDRWTTQGQHTDIPKVVYGDSYSAGFAVSHSGNVEDGSFVRLKNVALGYRIPQQLINGIGIASVRVYAQATNLFTLTNYTGSDPEISMNGNSNLGTGTEQNSVPGARMFTFGLNVGF